MKIDTNTTQAELSRLYKAIVRQEFLKGTPLNLKFFLRYTIMFLLFPAMILGFWVGLGVTAVFCLFLVGALYWDYTSLATVSCFSWMALGLLPICYITYRTYRKAAQTKRLRLMVREPLPGKPSRACTPQNQALKWNKQRRKNNQLCVASLVLQAPEEGIYALLLSIPEYNGARLLTDGPAGVCILQKNAPKTGPLNALLLYNLKQGAHEITWSLFVEDEKQAPTAYITQINKVG